MGQNNNTYDVMIVGAGVIGSVLALDLAKQGYHVAILDLHVPSFQACDPERVIALSEGSARYLDSLGVWQAILENGAGLIQHIAVCEPGFSGAVDMYHDELQGADALGYVLEIRHVLQPVQQAFTDQITTLYGTQCLSFTEHDAGVTLDIQQGDETQRIDAKLLIGADGSYSFIRSHAGIQTYGYDHNRLGIVASITCEYGHDNTAYECFKEQGPLALLPLTDGRFSLVWSVAPKTAMELMGLSDEGFLHMLSHEVGEEIKRKLGVFTATSSRATFPLELRVAKQFAKGRVLLAGNAAHTIHPIAGQGMNLGLRDVAVLADVLSQAWAKHDLDKPLIGQTYAERRRLDTLAVVAFTESTLETFASSFAPQSWLRRQGLNAMQATPALKHLLLKHAAGIAQLEG